MPYDAEYAGYQNWPFEYMHIFHNNRSAHAPRSAYSIHIILYHTISPVQCFLIAKSQQARTENLTLPLQGVGVHIWLLYLRLLRLLGLPEAQA